MAQRSDALQTRDRYGLRASSAEPATTPDQQCTASRCTASREQGSEHDQLIIEVPPSRVHVLDQLEFPCSAPVLQRPLAVTGFENGRVFFIVNQHHHAVLAREPGNNLCLMFPNTARKIVGHPDIKDALRPVCENVDEVTLAHP